MSNTTISYSGNVTHSIYKKGKLKYTKNMHNEGLYPLFYAMCNFLIGKGEDDRIPYYLDLCTKTTTEGKSTYTTVLNRMPIFQSKITEQYDVNKVGKSGSCKASFVAYMYKENVQNPPDTDKEEKKESAYPLYYVMRSQSTQVSDASALAAVPSGYTWGEYQIAEDETWVINWIMELNDVSTPHYDVIINIGTEQGEKFVPLSGGAIQGITPGVGAFFYDSRSRVQIVANNIKDDSSSYQISKVTNNGDDINSPSSTFYEETSLNYSFEMSDHNVTINIIVKAIQTSDTETVDGGSN